MTAPPRVRGARPVDRTSHPSEYPVPERPMRSTPGTIDLTDSPPPRPPPFPAEQVPWRTGPTAIPPGAGRGAVPGPGSALTDLADVFAVYPFRRDMPVCPHCVSDADRHALSCAPPRISAPVLDRYVTKAMITWGDTMDFKRLLPEILTRLDHGYLGAPEALIGARLRRAGWTHWPAAEAPAVRSALRAIWIGALAFPPTPGHVPVVTRLGLITAAEDDLTPYLDLWEDRLELPADPGCRLAATLHLADLLAPLATGGRRHLMRGFPLARRSVVGQLDHWLRQPNVVQRLARAADALVSTPHGPVVARARDGMARLRTDG